MTTIKPGQVFRSADPRGGARIRILRWQPGWKKAQVVDAATGKRQRQILVSALHLEPLTRDGQPRRTGYVLEVNQ